MNKNTKMEHSADESRKYNSINNNLSPGKKKKYVQKREAGEVYCTLRILLNLFPLVDILEQMFMTSIYFRFILIQIYHMHSVFIEKQECFFN